MKKLNSAILLVLILVSLANPQEIKRVHNSLKEIQAKGYQRNLELIQEWSGENEQDENKILSGPRDLYIDRSDYVYVLDACGIQIFDELGKYIKTIGRIGEGPGNLLDPSHLVVDNEGNILVIDGGRKCIQVFSPDGEHLDSFLLEGNRPGPIAVTRKNEILMSNRTLTKEATTLWTYYDPKGKIVRRNGIRQAGSSELVNDKLYEVNFVLDEKDNLYAAYVYRPLIQVYSSAGELICESTYEVPFKLPEIRSFRRPEGIFIEAEIVCKGIDVDSNGRMYLLSLTRPRSIEERKVGYAISAISRNGRISKLEKMKFDIDTHETDLYRILVFDQTGRIIASKKLSIHANNIRVHGDRLFLIDSYVNMKISEYKLWSARASQSSFR